MFLNISFEIIFQNGKFKYAFSDEMYSLLKKEDSFQEAKWSYYTDKISFFLSK